MISAEPPPPPVTSAPPHILIVEDDAGLSQLFGDKLRQAGCNVDTLGSARACLAWLEQQTPDLLLLDYSLPDLLAPALVAELRQSGRLPPFIVITGHGDERVAVELMKLGARDYLIKDNLVFDRLPAVVARTLQEVANERRLAAAEVALRTEKERAEQYFESAAVMMLVLDCNGRVARINSRGCEILGWSREEILGCDWFERCLPPAAGAEARRLFAEYVAGKLSPVAHAESLVRTRAGGERLLAWHSNLVRDAAGVVVGTLGSAEDITEKKRAEAALRHSEALFRRTFDEAPVGAALVGLDQSFQNVNAAFCRFLGYTVEELQGLRFPQITHPEDVAASREGVRQVLAGETPTFEQEKRYVRKDGGVVWGRVSVGLIRDEQGQPLLFFPLIEDVTARKEAEATLRESEAQLRRAELVGGFGHWELDFAKGVIRGSEGARWIYGLEGSEWPVAVVRGLPLPDYRTMLDERLRQVVADGGSYDSEFEIRRPDDGRIMAVHSLAHYDQAANMLFGIVQDVSERWRMERALKESEERFRAVVENAPIAAWVQSEMRFAYLNPAALRLYGAERREQLLGQSVLDHCRPDFRAEAEDRIRRQRAGQTSLPPSEQVFVRFDGTEVTVELSSSPFLYDGRPSTVAFARDVSERKRAEVALRESEEKFAKAFRNSPVPMAIRDLASSRYVDANDRCLALMGYSREEVIGHSPLEIEWMDAADREENARLMQAAGGVTDRELRLRRKDGATVICMYSSYVIQIGGRPCVLSTTIDITERKRAETELEQFFELVPDMVCITGVDGFLKKVNEEWTRVLGYTKAELMAVPFTELIHPEDRKATFKQVARLLAGKSTASFVNRQRAKDGTYRWVEWKATPVSRGSLVFASARDITERKTAEAALQRVQSNLSALLESTQDLIWSLDLTYRLVAFNSSLREHIRRQFGTETRLGARPEDLLPPERAALWVSLYDRALQEGAFRVELPRTDDGFLELSLNLVYAGTEKVGVAVFGKDITERKRAEVAVVAAERFTRSTIDALAAHLCVLDATGIILATNQQWNRFAEENGGDPGKVGPGNNYLDTCDAVTGPDAADAAIFAAGIRAVISGSRDTFAHEYSCHSPREQRWFSGLVTRFASGGPVRVVVTHENVTERKAAAAALQASEEKFAKVFRGAPVWIVITDLADATYLDVNEEALRASGFTREEVIGHTAAELGWLTAADRARLVQEIREHGRFAGREMEFRTKAGGHRTGWVNGEQIVIGGRPCLLTVTIDVTERKQAESALRESEAKFATVFRDAPVMIAITDLTDGKFVDINDEASRRSGFSRAETVGHTGVEIGWLSREGQNRLYRAALKYGRVAGMEMTFSAKDGRVVYGWISGERIVLGGRPCLLTVATDLTERKQAEETMAWEAALVDNSADVCCVKDLDLRVRAVNSAFLRMAGVESAAEVIGKTDAEIFGRPGTEANVEGYIADERGAQRLGPGESIVREETMVWPDGVEQILLTRKFPVFDPAGKLIATANISTDVTAHRLMEEALQHNERRYRLLFASNVAGVALHEIICDAAGRPCDYRFLEVNLAFERLTGLQSAALVGRTVLEVMPQTEPVWIERYGQVALSGDSAHFEQFSAVLGRHYEVSAYSPQRGQFAVMVLDVTERKRAEEALRESLREKEALLKEVHHRVKNNLQVISSLLRLESGQIEHIATKEVLGNMQERVRAMALLHENLYRSGNLAQVNMEAYLGAVCQQLLRTGSTRAAGTVDLQLQLAPLRLEMNQALPCGLLVSELVSNCLKHAFPGGRGGSIRVELQPVPASAEWCLRVDDDGVGLPPDFDIGHLRSLGLQLVSDLSRQIQGRLEYASPHGACFAVTFVVTPPSSASVS